MEGRNEKKGRKKRVLDINGREEEEGGRRTRQEEVRRRRAEEVSYWDSC